MSVWVDSLDGRGALEAALGGIAARVDGYLVTESMPLRCPTVTGPTARRAPA